jgi:hypothetical protein
MLIASTDKPSKANARTTAARERETIARFVDRGESGPHSSAATTLPWIINHCERESINYVLTRGFGGYYIQKLPPDTGVKLVELTPELEQGD